MIAGILPTVRARARHAPPAACVSQSVIAATLGLALCITTSAPFVCRAADIIINDVVIEGNIQGNVFVQQMFVQPALPDEVFDQWLYGAGRTAAGGRSRLDTLLQLKVDDVERTCSTTAQQRQKLTLAGRGDIQRFYDRVDDVHKKFKTIQNDLNRINEIQSDLRPLQLSLSQGLFGDGSLYAKTLKKTLSPEQAEQLARADRERQLFAFQARVELTIASLGNALGLRAEQREKLMPLLLAELRPSARPGAAQSQVIMYQMSRIPEDRLKPLFDPGQWRILSGQFVQARKLEPVLRQSGLLPADEIDAVGVTPQGKTVIRLRDGQVQVFEVRPPAAVNRFAGEKQKEEKPE